MLSKIVKAIDKYGMFDGVENVTVALSGGPDSVCLLTALCELKDKYGITLSAVHINHQLRGEESFRDEEFTKKLCESKNVPLTVIRVDIKRIAESTGESIELAARNVRYQIFKEVADGVVATGHSADDNLETVLYNMTRGTGLKGLCGIPPKREIFVRPLILCSRTEIEKYLGENGIDFVTDSSNLTDEYTRNFFRNNIVPLLKTVNKGAEKNVSVMSSNLREDNEFIESVAKKIYTLCLKDNYLDAQLLRVQHCAIIKRVIAIYLSEQYDIKVDAMHLEICKDILFSEGRAGLCQGMSAYCRKGKFQVKSDLKDLSEQKQYSVQLKKVLIENTPKINNLFQKNAIDCDKIIGELEIRTRRPSDKIQLRGRNCTKTLKKLMNELKIEEDQRELIPVAADDEGVVWIYGVDVSERVKVDSNTKTAIEFKTELK